MNDIEKRNYEDNFWIHIVIKQIEEIEKRYYNIARSPEEVLKEIFHLFQNKVVVPFADFSVGTVCSLKCRDCSQWLPYMKEQRTYSYGEIEKNVQTIFKYLDYIHFLSPLGGEPFLNKEIYEIMKMFIDLAEQGKIGFIRIVTNGTICPDERVFELLKHMRVYVLISEYGEVLNTHQKENKKKLIEQLERYECKYYMAENFEWINLGRMDDSPKVCTAELEKRFKYCFAKNCVGIYGTKMYHCSRAYALQNSKGICPNEEEFINFGEISSKEELQKRLEKFYSLDSLSSCRYCNPCEERYLINPAIQV